MAVHGPCGAGFQLCVRLEFWLHNAKNSSTPRAFALSRLVDFVAKMGHHEGNPGPAAARQHASTRDSIACVSTTQIGKHAAFTQEWSKVGRISLQAHVDPANLYLRATSQPLFDSCPLSSPASSTAPPRPATKPRLSATTTVGAAPPPDLR